MKKLISLVLAAAMLSGLAVSCCKYETVKGDPLKTKIYTLDNGLKVYMTVNKDEPRIQTYMAVRVGGKNDPSETTGLAHYFEHLMFKGTEQFGTSDFQAEKPMLDRIEQLFEIYRKTSDEKERKEIYRQIDSISYEASKLSIPNEYDKLMAVIGAQGTNAWTSTDETVYTEDIPSNQIENWAKIQADRFMHTTIRGFHTELETIYEEKNMSLTNDGRKVWEAILQELFHNHPYGKQTVLGTQEHLKNPSITNVRKYHDQYYVPNNIAICLSGDFNPDEMVRIIEKYFGEWKPNPEIPVLEYAQEEPITTPVEKDVYGLTAEQITMGWRLPGERDLKNQVIATVAGEILYNGQAGLIDLDVNQLQKTLYLYGVYNSMPDYSVFEIAGRPKDGQTLEEVRDIALGEVAKLRNGEFDDDIISSVVNNLKLNRMRSLEKNGMRARYYVNAFIAGIDWKDYVAMLDEFEKVTKEDIVGWANEFLCDNNYVIAFKRIGEDKSIQKISAPKITPIETNRNIQSAFLSDIKNTQVKPIEPVFVDFKKDLSQFKLANGLNVMYKTNETNDLFNLTYLYNAGTADDAALAYAFDYISYLGTETMTAEEIAKKMYSLGCSFNMSSSRHSTSISISGLSENMDEAVKIVEDLILNAKADDAILDNLKSDIIKSRINNKKNQSSCFNSLRTYVNYGPEFIRKSTMTNGQVMAMTSEDLISKAGKLFACGHEVLYYGPAREADVKKSLEENHIKVEDPTPLEEKFDTPVVVDHNSVVLAQYDAKQLYYYQSACEGKKYDKDATAIIKLYNEYFGGGMNAIVFQEMREARGLAYSAQAVLYSPSFKDDCYSFMAFIATQNDKMQIAMEAFDDIINNMPESQAAFDIAKESLVSAYRTDRVIGQSILYKYLACRRLGLEEPDDKEVFEQIQKFTLEDVKAFQQGWIKDSKYTFGILGDIKDLDVNYLKTVGNVKTVSLEEIFGY